MARSPQPHTDRDLLGKISRSAGQKAGYKQLIRELGLGGGRERRLLLEQLTRMVARKELVQLHRELWGIPKTEVTKAPKSGNLWAGMEQNSRSGRDRLISGRL